MAGEAVRARYRQPAILLVILLMMGLTVAIPIVAVTFHDAPWWLRLLFPAIAIPYGWWYVLVSTVYRMDLTDTQLRLRAPLAFSRLALDDLAEIGAPYGRNMVKVVRRDGRSWRVLAGEGLVDFVDEVGRAAPHAQVRLSGLQRHVDRGYRFLGARPSKRR
jgi:hypothetical protein